MAGLDDLLGSLTRESGGAGGGGIDDLLGGLLGGGSGSSGASQGGGGGLGDLLGGLLGQGGTGPDMGTKAGGMNMGALVGALAPLVLGMLRNGGLSKLVNSFQQKGLGAKADSWVGPGDNEPVSGEEMRVALGDEEVHRFAQQAGLSDEDAADVLANVVPQVVNGLTPDGQVPSDDELGSLAARMGD